MCYRTTIAELDALCRIRPLTSEETDRLALAIEYEGRALGRKSLNGWSCDEDRTAKRLRAQGLPYSRIADSLNRSADAVAARLRSLRLREEAAR